MGSECVKDVDDNVPLDEVGDNPSEDPKLRGRLHHVVLPKDLDGHVPDRLLFRRRNLVQLGPSAWMMTHESGHIC